MRQRRAGRAPRMCLWWSKGVGEGAARCRVAELAWGIELSIFFRVHQVFLARLGWGRVAVVGS